MSLENRNNNVLVIMMVMLGIWLRLYDLGGDSLWHDEAFTWYFTRMPWVEMLDTVRLDGVNPPIYYMATKVLVDLFGDSERVLRGISALAGIAAMWGAWLVGREAGGREGGSIGLAVIAFHPMAVHYSRDARPYSLVLALGMFLIYAYLRLRKQESKRMWWAAWALLLFGQMSHYFFFVLGGTILLAALLELRERPLLFRKWALIWLGAFIPLGGWLWWYFSQPTPSLGIGWIEMPPLSGLLRTVWNLFSGFGGDAFAATFLFGSLTALLAATGLVLGKDRKRHQKEWLVWLVVPIIGVWVVSLRRPVYMDRYFIVFLPAIVYLVSAGGASAFGHWRDRGWKRAVDATLMLLILVGMWAGWGVHSTVTYSREDWRGLVKNLNENKGEGEAIWLSEPEASFPMQYYLRGDLGEASSSDELLYCQLPCWWVMRMPFTRTHAFSQSVGFDKWAVNLPDKCILLDRWVSESGLRLWKVQCGEAGE